MKLELCNRRTRIILCISMILLLAVLSPLVSGCNPLTARPAEPEQEEKTPEELEREAEEERRRLEEEQRLEEERIKEEHRLREEALREELGPFFVPLPPLEQEDNPKVKAKALYVTGNIAGLERRFNEMLELVENTELNSFVIDVKNDHGVMSYRSNIEIVQESGANRNVPIKDIGAVMEELQKRDIYPIARVVIFKDPTLPEYRNDWAIQRNTGGIWREKNIAWVDPYQKKVWDYNIAIAKEAALMGFREIQFDYVRFPENARRVDREAYYPANDGRLKEEVIEDFLAYAGEELEEYNVHLAADVFGVISTSWGDSDQIGQSWERISPLVDYIAPMVYPSHYGRGYFGYDVPDANPGGVIRRSLTDAIKRNAPLEEPAIIRPWLQSFTATWVRGHIRYTEKEVREQIEEALKLGIDEFMIWNAVNRYQPASFLPESAARDLEDKINRQREENNHDVLGRTAEEALEAYLEAVRTRSWREVYIHQSTGFTMDHNAHRDWYNGWTSRLRSYTIKDHSLAGDQYTFNVNMAFTVGSDAYQLEDVPFEVFSENHIWRVKPGNTFIEKLTYEPAPDPEDEETQTQP